MRNHQKRKIGPVCATSLVTQILGLKGVVVSKVSLFESEIVVELKAHLSKVQVQDTLSLRHAKHQ
ncbi:hypothetical protein, partial [Ferrithrix thermotolerans]|uniref:hypothetical protein n=1 Tax=Ferrithrix thermotolerans TaxID=209649 RepID=UPI001C4A2B79